ncbi:MAG: tripartite tricarboxylate transporter substrate-binding protein, partial [Alphaproteobacteria bacterium]
PAGTPPAIVDRLHRETVRVLARPEAGQRLAALGAVPIGNSPQEFAAAIRRETPQWARLIAGIGLKLN